MKELRELVEAANDLLEDACLATREELRATAAAALPAIERAEAIEKLAQDISANFNVHGPAFGNAVKALQAALSKGE